MLESWLDKYSDCNPERIFNGAALIAAFGSGYLYRVSRNELLFPNDNVTTYEYEYIPMTVNE